MDEPPQPPAVIWRANIDGKGRVKYQMKCRFAAVVGMSYILDTAAGKD